MPKIKGPSDRQRGVLETLADDGLIESWSGFQASTYLRHGKDFTTVRADTFMALFRAKWIEQERIDGLCHYYVITDAGREALKA